MIIFKYLRKFPSRFAIKINSFLRPAIISRDCSVSRCGKQSQSASHESTVASFNL